MLDNSAQLWEWVSVVWEKGIGEWMGYIFCCCQNFTKLLLLRHIESFAFAPFSALSRLRQSHQQNTFESDTQSRENVRVMIEIKRRHNWHNTSI